MFFYMALNNQTGKQTSMKEMNDIFPTELKVSIKLTQIRSSILFLKWDSVQPSINMDKMWHPNKPSSVY